MTRGRFHLLAAFLIAACPAGPVFAEGAFDPGEHVDLGNKMNPAAAAKAEKNPEAAPAGLQPGFQGQRNPAQVRAAAIKAAEKEVGRPLTVQEKATVNGAITKANKAAGTTVSPEVATGIAKFMVANPKVAGDQKASNRVVNAFVWGSKFIKADGGGLNFSVRSEKGKAVVVPNAGATTKGMQISVRDAAPTGPVTMKATAENGLGFNMTESRIGRGSGNFVSSVHMDNADAKQNGAFKGVAGINKHQENGGALKKDAPNVQGRGGVDVTFKADGNGKVNANWQVGRGAPAANNAGRGAPRANIEDAVVALTGHGSNVGLGDTAKAATGEVKPGTFVTTLTQDQLKGGMGAGPAGLQAQKIIAGNPQLQAALAKGGDTDIHITFTTQKGGKTAQVQSVQVGDTKVQVAKAPEAKPGADAAPKGANRVNLAAVSGFIGNTPGSSIKQEVVDNKPTGNYIYSGPANGIKADSSLGKMLGGLAKMPGPKGDDMGARFDRGTLKGLGDALKNGGQVTVTFNPATKTIKTVQVSYKDGVTSSYYPTAQENKDLQKLMR